jgi:hypothetical protein
LRDRPWSQLRWPDNVQKSTRLHKMRADFQLYEKMFPEGNGGLSAPSAKGKGPDKPGPSFGL